MNNDLIKIDLHTDGACSGNPGPGGWCSILVFQGVEKVLSGSEAYTTNNKMELQAVLEGLIYSYDDVQSIRYISIFRFAIRY